MLLDKECGIPAGIRKVARQKERWKYQRRGKVTSRKMVPDLLLVAPITMMTAPTSQ
jgi:hypothetical protein